MGKKPIFLSLGKPSCDMPIKRNYRCPDYEECLDKAAYADLDLDCSLCRREEWEEWGQILNCELPISDGTGSDEQLIS